VNNEKFQELIIHQLDKISEHLGILEQGQNRLEERQVRLEERIASLEQGQARLEHRLDSVEHRLDSVEDRLGSVEKSQLKLESRLENEVIEKIRILFDAWQVHEEKIQLLPYLNNTVERILIDTSYLVTRVTKLEKLAR